MQQAADEYFIFKEIYDDYMEKYGEYDCSRGINSKKRFNDQLFQELFQHPNAYDLSDEFNIVFMKNKQDALSTRLFQQFYIPDPLVRNEMQLVTDNDLILQTLQQLVEEK